MSDWSMASSVLDQQIKLAAALEEEAALASLLPPPYSLLRLIAGISVLSLEQLEYLTSWILYERLYNADWKFDMIFLLVMIDQAD
jgi:hypothetical protein